MAPLRKRTVKFSTAVYPEAAVRAAVREYAALASFRVERDGAYTKVEISAGPAAPRELTEEFANCVLFNSRP